jgi:hypothetical protein
MTLFAVAISLTIFMILVSLFGFTKNDTKTGLWVIIAILFVWLLSASFKSNNYLEEPRTHPSYTMAFY